MRYLIWFLLLFAGFNLQAQNNTVYGAGISYTNGAPTWFPNPRTSRAAVDTVTGRWYHFNTPGGWQWIGNTVEEISGCAAPAYTPGKGDSRIVVNNCTKPQVYWYDGTVWKWINEGEVYTAGQGIRIESNSIILDSLYLLRFRTGSNTDGAAGTMSWNATEETVDLVTDQGAVTGHLMESVYYNARNTTGTPIPISYVVMAAGTTGNTGRILITPAIADGSVNSEYILGLTAQAIGNNANGKVQHFGKIRGIQTNGANFGETWADGDVLYCSAATLGYLTKVQPAAPNLKIPIAIVIHAHPSNGTLFVRPSHFPDLAQINDVQLSSPTNGQVLTYNSTLSRWENATPADQSATNELQTLSTGTNTLTLSNGGGTVTVDTDPTNDVTGSGTSGQVSFWTGAQTQSGDNGLFWDNSSKRLGVGTNTPGSALDVFGNLNIKSANANNANFTITTNTLGAIATVTGGSANTRIFYFSPGGGDTRFVTTGVNTEISLWDATATQRIAFSSAFGSFISNNLTIGATGQTGRLHVRGSGTSSSTWTAQFHNSAGNNNALMIRDDGNVGVGTSSPSRLLTVAGDAEVNGLRLGKGNSSLAFNLAFGANSLNAITTGNNNTGIGANTLLNTTTGSDNFALGTQSLGGNTTGSFNIGIGYQTMLFNQTGNHNNAIGYRALYQARGSFNIGIGTSAASSNNTGTHNIAIGYRTLFNGTNNRFNTVVGTEAHFNGWNHQNNTSIGYQAGFYIGNGLVINTNISNSVLVGFDARPLDTAQVNQIVIGYQGRGLGSNTSRIGNTSTIQTHLDGSLTIGDTTLDPSAILDITSTTQGILFPRMTTTQRDLIATPADGLVVYNTTDNKLQVRAGGAWVDLH